MRAAERSKASIFAERNGKCVGAAVCCPVGNVGDSHCAVRLLARELMAEANVGSATVFTTVHPNVEFLD